MPFPDSLLERNQCTSTCFTGKSGMYNTYLGMYYTHKNIWFTEASVTLARRLFSPRHAWREEHRPVLLRRTCLEVIDPLGWARSPYFHRKGEKRPVRPPAPGFVARSREPILTQERAGCLGSVKSVCIMAGGVLSKFDSARNRLRTTIAKYLD